WGAAVATARWCCSPRPGSSCGGGGVGGGGGRAPAGVGCSGSSFCRGGRTRRSGGGSDSDGYCGRSTMNVSEPAILRPIGTTLLAIGLFLVGAVAYRFLPVASMPTVDFPTIWVSASRPGTDPETMAATVAAPLERRLGEIPGITEMTSRNSLGTTRITLQFDLNRSIDGAARDVQAALNAARTDLPSDLPSSPSFRKSNPNSVPVMILALT